ncbi:site-specific DNA-methyltransferase [Hyphomonas pacifica]|nr:site-specific DNA-methyltransferase [Hyphomonas pacifica]
MPRPKMTFTPTQKPVSLMEEVVSWTVGTVVDPFMGSGTTGVACIRQGRPFIGIEIDADYFEVALSRVDEADRSPSLFAV